MQLKKLTLQNFRCFESLELKLHPRLNIFVSENGGGKTAVLDAIAIALAQVTYGLFFFGTNISWYPTREIEKNDKRISPIIYAGEQYSASPCNPKISITTETGVDLVYEKTSLGNYSKRMKEEAENYEAYVCCDILEKIEKHPETAFPLFAYYGFSTEQNIKNVEDEDLAPIQYQGIVDALNPNHDIKTIFDWFKDKETKELRLKNEKQDFDVVLPPLELVRQSITALLGEDYCKPRFDPNGQFVLDKKDGTKGLNFSQLSQGYQRIFEIAADFSRRLAMTNAHLPNPRQAPAVMLIDEIDLHLHPLWQHRVLRDLLRTFPGTQFIVTTHSPYILTSVNNLLEAGAIYDKIDKGEIPETKKNELSKIVPENEALRSGTVGAFALADGGCRSIIDTETGLLEATDIDGVSEKIGADFEQLLNFSI